MDERTGAASDGSADRALIDCHTHLAWHDCVPQEFVEGGVCNVQSVLHARGLPATAASIRERARQSMNDPQGDSLIEEMDRAGIVKSAVLVPDMTFALKGSRLTIEELLIHHRQVQARHHDRLVMFAGVDPRWGRDGVDLLERAFRDWNFRGLKLYPPCGFEPSDPLVYPLYELCRAHGVPVLVHIGPTSPVLDFTTAHPSLLDRACRDFPTVNFVLGHGGAHFVEDCLLMAAFRPNVYLEVSGFQRAVSLQQAMDRLRKLFSQGINHKILFGSDYPVFNSKLPDITGSLWADDGPFAEQSQTDVELIARGNFHRLWEPALAPELTADAPTKLTSARRDEMSHGGSATRPLL